LAVKGLPLLSHGVLYDSKCEIYAKRLQVEMFRPRSIFDTCVRYMNNFIVGIIFSFLLRIRNIFKVRRRDTLLRAIFHRRQGEGLLSVSNHQSILDDPGIWAAVLPWWRMSPNKMRWSLCTEDVFFSNKYLTAILQAGNVQPLDRAGSIEQPLFQRFFEMLSSGMWCHIFPEGKIYQNWRFEGTSSPVLGPLKVGVGKLIAHCRKTPIVVPMYHRGMDKVVPEKRLMQSAATPSLHADSFIEPRYAISTSPPAVTYFARSAKSPPSELSLFSTTMEQPMDTVSPTRVETQDQN